MLFNILNYGAVGDGKTLNTQAFANAIQEAAATQEHSVVLVPPGVYLTGSITLRSNMTLRVEAGARILAAQDKNEYVELEEIVQRRTMAPEHSKCLFLSHYVIGAQNAENVIIEGDGIIDGSGDAFWEEYTIGNEPWVDNDWRQPVHYNVLAAKKFRPALISFWKCTHVILRGVQLFNAAAYTVWPQGCTQVRITDVMIQNQMKGPNTDALDIDCCSNVFISNCDISAGDDCIALKSDTARIGENRPCQFVTVSNCILTTTCNAIRVGYEGDGAICDCVFTNLVVHDTGCAVNILSVTPENRTDFVKGTPVERLIFSNIVAQNVAVFCYIWTGSETEERPCFSQVRHLTFSNIDADVRNGSYVGTKDGLPISDLTLANVRIDMREHPYLKDKPQQDCPGVWGHGCYKDGLWFHNVQNITLEHVTVTSDIPGGKAIRWEKALNLQRDHVVLPDAGTLDV